MSRDYKRFLLQTSLGIRNRLEAPVWLRMDLHKEFDHEAPIDGDHIAMQRTKPVKA